MNKRWGGRTIWIVRGEEKDESSSSSADPPQQFRELKKAAILPLKVVGSGKESNCLDIFLVFGLDDSSARRWKMDGGKVKEEPAGRSTTTKVSECLSLLAGVSRRLHCSLLVIS